MEQLLVCASDTIWTDNNDDCVFLDGDVDTAVVEEHDVNSMAETPIDAQCQDHMVTTDDDVRRDTNTAVLHAHGSDWSGSTVTLVDVRSRTDNDLCG